MPFIDAHLLPHSTVLRIYSERDSIKLDPDYQRNGEIWTLENRQLLIDSILNNYDIPKLYFHKLPKKDQKKLGKEYSIIDGRQRIESIWKFIDGEFPLSDDFVYLKDSNVNAKNFTYNDLAKKFPKIKIQFDSYTLPIAEINTDDLELIEDMFSRLNEAVPLNAAEKRNALGGYMAIAINKIGLNDFFKNKIRIPNKRYQHKEIAARLLFLTYCLNTKSKIIDTKKILLDNFVKQYKGKGKRESEALMGEVENILNTMNKVFTVKDKLLTAQGGLPIYYLLFRKAIKENKLNKISRNKLMNFEKARKKNRSEAELDITHANFELLEYDRLSQQGSNDSSSIRFRSKTLQEFFKIYL